MGLSARDIAFITVLCGVTTLNVFLLGAVTVALPTIGRDLNFQEVCLLLHPYYSETQHACV